MVGSLSLSGVRRRRWVAGVTSRYPGGRAPGPGYRPVPPATRMGRAPARRSGGVAGVGAVAAPGAARTSRRSLLAENYREKGPDRSPKVGIRPGLVWVGPAAALDSPLAAGDRRLRDCPDGWLRRVRHADRSPVSARRSVR